MEIADLGRSSPEGLALRVHGDSDQGRGRPSQVGASRQRGEACWSLVLFVNGLVRA